MLKPPVEVRDAMNSTTELKQNIHGRLDQLRALRDDVRVRLHLAGMEARDEWNKLEPRIMDLEKRVAGELTDASCAALDDAVRRLSKLRDRMRAA
jgi:hypothetical protein